MLADGSVGHRARPGRRPRRRSKAALSARPFKAVAICLLNAYANPAHERALAELIRAQFPDLYVSCSSEISREFREYERASTTALSAYVQPIIDSYLGRFEDAPRARRLHRAASRSCSPTAAACRRARSAATRSPRSSPGPAAGVMGAIRQIGASGYQQPHHVRHGRHQHRRVPRLRRQADHRARDGRRRPADPHAGRRHRIGRRGRRQHRLARHRRHAARRAALERRRSRARPATAAAAPRPPSPMRT